MSFVRCFIVLALLALVPPAFAQPRHGVDRSTDVLMLLPTAAGLVGSLAIKDYKGTGQLLLGAGVSLAASYALERAVHKGRPDGSGGRAFPSTHATVAFQGAAFLQRRYGWKFGVPAYLVAAYVAWGRTYARQHDWWDVAAGAALGIAGSYVFTRPLKRNGSVVVAPTLIAGEHPGLCAAIVF